MTIMLVCWFLVSLAILYVEMKAASRLFYQDEWDWVDTASCKPKYKGKVKIKIVKKSRMKPTPIKDA